MTGTPDPKLEEEAQARRDGLEAAMAALSPDITDPLAQQAAAMMMEDLRAYLQAFEQVSLAASAKAMSVVLKDPALGEAALKVINEQQKEALSFAKGVTDLATTIRTQFRDRA
jgi:hypothetical protein